MPQLRPDHGVLRQGDINVDVSMRMARATMNEHMASLDTPSPVLAQSWRVC